MILSWNFYYYYSILFYCINVVSSKFSLARSQQVNGIKGQFMSHMLHSAYFFPHTGKQQFHFLFEKMVILNR